MLELDIIKQHVRLEPDFIDDDELLDTFSNAAVEAVESKTGRTLYATAAAIPDGGDEHALVLNDGITAAMLLLIGHLYENREAVTVGEAAAELPLGVDALLIPYRHYHF